MSEFDNLKNEAEQYAQQHPEQVKEGEDAVEKKFGMGQQDQSGQGGPQDQYGQGQQDQGNYGQGQQDQQDQSGQGASKTSTARASKTREYGQGQQDQYAGPAGPVRRRPAVGLLALSAEPEATVGAGPRRIVRHGCLVPVACLRPAGSGDASQLVRAKSPQANRSSSVATRRGRSSQGHQRWLPAAPTLTTARRPCWHDRRHDGREDQRDYRARRQRRRASPQVRRPGRRGG